MNTVVDFTAIRQNCSNCKQVKQCFPESLADETLRQFGKEIRPQKVIQRGEALFRQGDHLNSVYLVRSGAIKVYALSHDGTEQVLGFYLPGDMLGLGALESDYHDSTALALETSSVCEVSFAKLETMSQADSGLYHWLNRSYGREIARDHALLRLLGHKSAEQRLAGFLLSLSERFAQRGFSSTEFNLSMSRHDIANYLGLALETVSRLFARFQECNALVVNRRHITVRDPLLLQRLAGMDNIQPISQQRH